MILILSGLQLHRPVHLPKAIRLGCLVRTPVTLVALVRGFRHVLESMSMNLPLMGLRLGGLTTIVLNTLPVTRTDTGTAE